MKNIWVILSSALIIFTSCSSSKSQILLNEYQNKSPQSSILILPIDNYFSINHEDDGFKNMSDQDRRNFDNLFGLVFQDYTSSKVFGIDNNLEIETTDFEKVFLKLAPNDSVSFMLPQEKKSLLFYDNKPEFILFLQEYYMDFKAFQVSKSLSMQSNSGDKNYLILKTKYVIWDNRESKIAGWGKIEARNNFNNKITREVYLDLIGKLSKTIIEVSPL